MIFSSENDNIFARTRELGLESTPDPEWIPIRLYDPQVHPARVLCTWADTWTGPIPTPHVEVCEQGERGEWFYSYDGETCWRGERPDPPTHFMRLMRGPR